MTDFAKAVEEAKAEVMPFESWERLRGESSTAFAAFCVFRDFGSERNIKKALLSVESDGDKANRQYRTWLNWSAQFHWLKRAADYDKYLDKLKLAERRKVIEAREEAHREITAKMLFVVKKKLDMMNPDELTQGNVTEWVKTAVQTERDILGMGKEESGVKQGQFRQGEINFDGEFSGV